MSAHNLPCPDCDALGQVEYVAGHPHDPHARTYFDDCCACNGRGWTECDGEGCDECDPVCVHGLGAGECGDIDCCDEKRAARIVAAAIAEAKELADV